MKVFWTESALQYLKHIRVHLEGRDSRATSGVGNLICKATDRMADLPSIGRPGLVPNTRELTVLGLPFMLCYTVEDNCMMVLAVMHISRKCPESS